MNIAFAAASLSFFFWLPQFAVFRSINLRIRALTFRISTSSSSGIVKQTFGVSISLPLSFLFNLLAVD
ncbi:hypothetical protein HanRHA438_Chr03g0100181 [Helianthus annuus]|nr:hypothetical protein HanRHA438_Chr03g0100181 [Helianthus annuus]